MAKNQTTKETAEKVTRERKPVVWVLVTTANVEYQADNGDVVVIGTREIAAEYDDKDMFALYYSIALDKGQNPRGYKATKLNATTKVKFS